MPQLVDYLGRPIELDELMEEQAVPSVAGVRTVWYDSVANTLTPERLASIIVEVDQNDTTNYLTLAEEMEERELHYRSVLSTRKLAVSGLTVGVEAYSDDAKDVEIADAVRDAAADDAFPTAVRALLDGIGKGYAVAEIMWDRSGSQWYPGEYKWRDPRHFVFDQDTGENIQIRDLEDPVEGVPLAPFKFLVHKPMLKMGLPIRSGLARLAAVAYMCKGYTLKDWIAFAEVFGMPLRVGKYGTDATPQQKAALLRAVTNIGTDAAAIIPESMMLEFIEAQGTAGGEKLFLGLAEYLDKQVSKGVLGQTATVEGTVGKLGAEDAQEQVRQDIQKDDAGQLAATLRRDFVRPFVDLNFGPRNRGQYPKLRLFAEEYEDLVQLSEALPPFIDRGLRVEESVIRDKFGLAEPEEGADVLGKKAAPPPPTPPDEQDQPPPQPDNEDEEEKEAAREIFRKVRRGEPLTPDQRALMVATTMRGSAAAQGDDMDAIDRMVEEELGDWQKMMDPVLQPILDHAKESSSYQEFLAGLEDVMAKVDSTEFAKRLAVATFKARGLGDGTDEI